jgi:hypothetical protein
MSMNVYNKPLARLSLFDVANRKNQGDLRNNYLKLRGVILKIGCGEDLPPCTERNRLSEWRHVSEINNQI